MKKTIALLILLLLPSVLAFPCKHLGAVEWVACKAISQTGLEQYEKDVLVSSMLYAGSIPNHEIIKKWNLDISPTSPPHDINAESRGYIKDAWIKIFGIYPSVEYNNVTLAPSKGQVHAEYNYNIEYPEKERCGNKYRTIDRDEELSVYANGVYIGNDKLQSYNIKYDTTFKVNLDIEVETRVKYYRSKRGGGCKHTGTDIVVSNIELSDSFEVKLDSSEPQANFRVIDFYADTLRAQTKARDYSSLVFESTDSNAGHYLYHYSIGWEHLPYYVIHLKAVDNEHFEAGNLVAEYNNGTIDYYFPEQKKCSMETYNHFNNFDVPCSLKIPDNAIKIKTAKTAYKQGESIEVETSPKYSPVKVIYCGEEKTSYGSVEFPATEKCGRIEAEHEGVRISRNIEVMHKKSWSLLWKILTFVFIVYVLYKIIAKYIGGLIP